MFARHITEPYIKTAIKSAIISLVGVFVIDYFSHLLFSEPMETRGYFMAKAILYFVFSIGFLSIFDPQKKEFLKVIIAGIAVSALWGMYYNVFPLLFDYHPFGISLAGLTFLGMGILGTGLAFGIVHTLAFIAGYYAGKSVLKFRFRHGIIDSK